MFPHQAQKSFSQMSLILQIWPENRAMCEPVLGLGVWRQQDLPLTQNR